MADIESSGDVVANGGVNYAEDTDENTPDDGTLDTEEDGQEDDQGAGDNPAGTAADAGFDPSTITDPQLQAAYRQMQAAFTPRLQEAADIRRQYGDLDPQVVDSVRQYQQLLQSNPIAARQFLADEQARLESHFGLQQQPDPFQNVEALTPTEETMLTVGRQMWQRLQQQELEIQQQRFLRQQEMADRQFAQIESRYKTQVPLEEKQQVWAYMQKTGLQDAEAAWKILNFDKAAQVVSRKQAQVVQQKKKTPPPPTNRQPRSAPQTKSSAKGIAGHFEEAWNQFNQG